MVDGRNEIEGRMVLAFKLPRVGEDLFLRN